MIKQVLISSSVLVIFLGINLSSTATAKESELRTQLDETPSLEPGLRSGSSPDSTTSDVDTLFEQGSTFSDDPFSTSNNLKTYHRSSSNPFASPNSGFKDSGSRFTGKPNSRDQSDLTEDAYTSSGPDTSLPDTSPPNTAPNWH
ncbi:hypothetical protein K9N68_03100 [Kovacikia minuta CCNUW1]|uniref:hypothetical protein n=1 Tax=Kovacikia minuta TaxID=2931930 RepID=UPI001CCDC9C6|nr:hypothetical protein [Kovacikia minuta]UBF26982.1 hypothetical protein K9N68_03100 [Kovacikia minuta CCNUW1]